MDRVDVVVPSIGRLTLTRALVSVLEQRGIGEVKVVVVADREFDDVRRQVDQLRDSRIQLIAGRGDGPAAARNRGIEQGSAPLVAFLDDDDVWSPDKLARQVAALGSEPTAVLAYCDHLYGVGARALPSGMPLFQGKVHGRLLRDWHPALGSSLLVRRDALGAGFDPALPALEDLDLLLRLSLAGQFVVVPEPLCLVEQHGGWRESQDTGARNEAARTLRERYAPGSATDALSRLTSGAATPRERLLRWLGLAPGSPRYWWLRARLRGQARPAWGYHLPKMDGEDR